MANGIYALQPNTGALLWSYLTTNGIISSPALGIPRPPTAPATSATSGTAVIYSGPGIESLCDQESANRLSQNDPPVPHLQISPEPDGSGRNGGDVRCLHETTDGDQVFYSWGLGDGTPAPGAVVTTTGCRGPAQRVVSGAYPITLNVTDGMADKQLAPKPNMNVTGGGTRFFRHSLHPRGQHTLGSPGSGGVDLPPPCPSISSLQWQEELLPPSMATSMSIGGNQLVTEGPTGPSYIATVSGLRRAGSGRGRRLHLHCTSHGPALRAPPPLL